jgi:outer membrane protein insertion porin family
MRLILLFSTLLFFAACTGTGKLREGERLYDGAKIKIDKREGVGKTKQLKADLKRATSLPRPNKRFLWIRSRLSIYNTFHNEGGKNLGNFIADRFGEPPVLYNSRIVQQHGDFIEERAANDGFFDIMLDTEEKSKKHSVKLIHRVTVLSPRKTFDQVIYPPDTTELLRAINSTREKTVIKSGNGYWLEDMMSERTRLADTLRNRGWYYFSPDHFLWVADTVKEKPNVDITLTLKDEVGAKERQRYRLRSVTVYPDYDLGEARNRTHHDTLQTSDCIKYVYRHFHVTPGTLEDNIFLRCGEYYSNDAYQSTIYRLLNLNLYKFINIRFFVARDADSLLDARIYLTPFAQHRVDGEVSAIFSPKYYGGVQAGLNWIHRNTFGGAEELRTTLNGAYLKTNKTNLSFEQFFISDGRVQLSLPRFWLIREKQDNAFNTTRFSLRHQANYFRYDLADDLPGAPNNLGVTFQRANAEAGYLWRKDRRGSAIHEINPVNLGVQYTTMTNRAFKNQQIARIPDDTTGNLLVLLPFVEYKPNYTITVDKRLEPGWRYTIYYRQRFAASASGFIRPEALPASYQLKAPINLFSESDFRQYNKVIGRNVLATRTAFAIGIPLRPNTVIALLDRYTVGGASSVRAFAPRTVGPGSVAPGQGTEDGLSLTEHTGNILLEGSVEYRMPLGRYPELAFFVDAGNVWALAGQGIPEESRFRFSRFYKELAVGAGVGFRLNLGFFVLRLDLATPLTKPYLPEGERFVLDDFDLGSKDWRRENLLWNFAFGYPF